MNAVSLQSVPRGIGLISVTAHPTKPLINYF